jgi:hypothetical protein
MKEFRRAIVYVWLMISAAAGVTAAAPFMIPAAALQRVFPQCEARARNSACPACGLTTGFIAISDGRWDEAQQANAAAIPLLGIFAANFAAAIAYAIRKSKTGATTCK